MDHLRPRYREVLRQRFRRLRAAGCTVEKAFRHATLEAEGYFALHWRGSTYRIRLAHGLFQLNSLRHAAARTIWEVSYRAARNHI